ncbi:MAG: hypothetical protein IT449_16115 [Phycisphaerales bacterium]|nr:hypothetical protein [Phycisphaerales bacterium]
MQRNAWRGLTAALLLWYTVPAWAQLQTTGSTSAGDDESPEGCSESGLVYPSCTWLDTGSGVGIRRSRTFNNSQVRPVRGLFVDPQGNVIMGGEKLVSGLSELNIIKYERDGDTAWSVSPGISTNDYAKDVAVDLSGDVLVAEDYFENGHYKIALIKLRGSNGSTVWSAVYPTTNESFDVTVRRVVVDDDGNSYLVGVAADTDVVAIKYGPDGVRQWVFQIATQPGNNILAEQVETDSSGNVYALTRNTTGDASAIIKLTPRGQLSSTWRDVGAGVGIRRFAGERYTSMVVHRTGRLMIGGNNNQGNPKVRVLSTNGTTEWGPSHTSGTGAFTAVTCNEAGEFAATGNMGDDVYTVKYNTDGSRTWGGGKTWDGTSGIDRGADVVMDRLGNVYSAGKTDQGSTTNDDWVLIKYDTEDGHEVWSDLPDSALIFSNNGNWIMDDGVSFAQIDGGGFLYLAGYVSRNDGTNDAAVLKLGQPFLSSPVQYFNSDVQMQTRNQSIWASGQGGVEYTLPILDGDFEVDEHPGGEEAGFGGGLDLVIDGDGGNGQANLSVGLRAVANGGTVDASIPFNVNLQGPGRDDIINGKPVTLVTSHTRDPSSSVAVQPVELNAYLTIGVRLHMLVRMWLKAFGEFILDFYLLNRDICLDEDTNNGQCDPVDFDIIDLGWILGQFGVGEFDLPYSAGSGEYRIPQVAPRGKIDSNGEFHLQGDDPFLSITLDATGFVASKFGIVTTFEEGIDLAGAGNAEISAGVAQGYLTGDFSLDQEFDFTPGAPSVRFTFSDGLAAKTINLGDQLTFDMPSDADVVVTPHFKVPSGNNFTSTTNISFRPTVSFDGLTASAYAEAFDVTLLDKSLCFICSSYSPGQLLQQIYRRSFNLGGFTEITGTPFTIIGRTATNPELLSASRDGADVYLFDQTSVVSNYAQVLADFDEFASGTTSMLLYGQDFLSTANCKAWFTHLGRSEQLTTTRLSNNELLVELPNKFRLLSGIGRIQVKSNRGNSNTIDFPIRNPYPNVVTVGPNLWAADPDLTNVLITVVDGKTSAGSDSYIARSDYYAKLRQLWTDSGLPGTIDGTFTSADFNGLPPMPRLLWNDEALTPYGEPLDSGLLWAELPRNYYGAPVNVEVSLISPGPGGGQSDSVPLTVAAPKPEITGITPDTVAPGSDDLRLVIRGPENVGWWQDTNGAFVEQQRRSNFNRASVVLWDGSANGIETRFVSSSHLVAFVPASKLQSGGTHTISVQTPDNGTVYFDHNVGANVPSGGTSNRVRFQVMYPRPEVTAVSPVELATSSLFGDARDYDLALIGTGFSDTTIVYWNGSARNTFVESDTLLQVKLLPADVEIPGDYEVYAVTPGPGGGRTDTITMTVISDDEDHSAPSLTLLTPSSARKDSGDVVVTMDGAGFYYGTRVYWNHETPMLYSRFISPTRMEVTIPADKLHTAGSFTIHAVSAPPGGGTSNDLIFTVVP